MNCAFAAAIGAASVADMGTAATAGSASRTAATVVPEAGVATRFAEAELRRIMRLSPLPPVPDDPSNAVADDPRAAAFGERLFFEPRLSLRGDTSCATCHAPLHAWADGRRVADPDARFPKNVPSLWNTAYNRWYFWDGRTDSAWAQALAPLESEGEMGSNRLRIIDLVQRDPTLSATYVAVFGAFPDGLDDPSRFPGEGKPIPESRDHPLHRAWARMRPEDRHRANQVFSNLGKAIAAFERRIVAPNIAFDRYVAALGRGIGEVERSPDALSEAAVRGLKLFVGRAGCNLCHSGPLLSDGEFHDVGIALGDQMRVDPGRHRGVLKLLRSLFTRAGPYSDTVIASAPVHFLEQRTHQLGQFKTPSLRGVADTAPYMHDGRFETLDEVVRFYSTREGANPLGHPTSLLQPLHLSEREVADLVAFLEGFSHRGQRVRLDSWRDQPR